VEVRDEGKGHTDEGTPPPISPSHTHARGYARNIPEEHPRMTMMMMMEGTMSSVSKENVEVIDALVSNFALYDDVNKVYDIGKTYRKLDQVAKDKEEQIKQDIRELSKKVQVLEASASSVTEAPSSSVPLETVRADLADAKRRAKELEEDIRLNEAELSGAMVERERKLREGGQHAREEAKEGEQRAKHELSLFAHVSKISWTNKRGENASIDGVISKVNSGDVKRFSFDRREKMQDLSNFDIANKLWEMMED